MMQKKQIEQTIAAIDAIVNPNSDRFGRLLNWQKFPDPFWHYGIGLSNTHIFDTGQGLCHFEKTEAKLVLGIEDIAFQPTKAIARLKQALYVFSDWEYNLIGWNCEHLGRLIVTDQPRCYQSVFLWWMSNLTPSGDHKTAQQIFRDQLLRVDASLT